MKFLHTADWHLGQLFHEYDRTYEHRQFLNWLAETLVKEDIDVLLICGDVFDLSNPAATTVKLFYTFLNKAVKSNPDLQIIITAGNHDSASRLESPKPLLESSNIHIVGLVERSSEGAIEYEKLVIPIKNNGEIKAWCLAIPFLRLGDYPVVSDCSNPYVEGIALMYQEAYDHALTKRQNRQPILALGHLHAMNAEITDMDKTERLIMGGVEGIAATAFHEDICYVALGHIHKAQRIGEKEHMRYCGSPLPMSFSEINYKHQVLVFEMDDCVIGDIHSIEVPASISLKRLPLMHKNLADVIAELSLLAEADEIIETWPYLEVRVLLDGPEPALRHKIETALTGKKVRLAKIDVKYKTSIDAVDTNELITHNKLHELQPAEVFARIYQSKYNNVVPDEIMGLFNQVAQTIGNEEY